VFIGIFFSIVLGFLKTLYPGIETTKFSPDQPALIQTGILDYLWVADLLITLSFFITAAVIIRRTFFAGPKNAWRPLIATVCYIPWIFPLVNMFRQWVFLSPQLPFLENAWDYYVIDLLCWFFAVVFSAIIWVFLGLPEKTYGHLSKEQRKQNKQLLKERDETNRADTKIARELERNRKKQLVKTFFSGGKNQTENESIDARQVEASNIEAGENEDTALEEAANQGQDPGTKAFAVAATPSAKKLNIRVAVQIFVMLVLWFVAMWLCDQGLVTIQASSPDFPLFLGVFDISGFSNFAASVYQALGFPMAQGKPYLLQVFSSFIAG
jgi:hypothetical protein